MTRRRILTWALGVAPATATKAVEPPAAKCPSCGKPADEFTQSVGMTLNARQQLFEGELLRCSKCGGGFWRDGK